MLKSSLLVAACAAASLMTASQTHAEVMLFPHFRSNGETGVFLSYSTDGVNFTYLNNGNPIFTPPQWGNGQNLTRDPSIVYRDGLFHMVWTSNWSGNVFGYATSPNLKDWSAPQMIQPFASTATQPNNVWAPEIHWDPHQNNFAVVFSSTVAGAGSGHRMYLTRMINPGSDASSATFSNASLFFDQGFSAIDGQMFLYDRNTPDVAADDLWVMVFKNEENGQKNLRVSTRDVGMTTPWTTASASIVGPGSNVRGNEVAEGSTLLRIDNTWYLYWDAFGNNHYSLATSTDLVNWTDLTGPLNIPDGSRHGTIFLAPESAIGFPGIPGNFSMNIPEPTSALPLLTSLGFLSFRRRK